MTEQKFLQDLEKKLWTSANKLLPSLDAAVYKHVVLGMVFVKYVSDSFETRRQELMKAFTDPDNDYYLGEDPDDFIEEELENRDYYTEKNVFWVPAAARWQYIQDNIRLSLGSALPLGGEFKGAGKMLDDTMELIEKENPKLKRILNKNYAQLQIEQNKLADLLDLIATIPFSHETLKAKDILGHVYEYFLGQFAAAEGKKGGQFYTPKSIVNLLVELVEPYKGRVYDPAMGSGGFFISSEKFIEEHSGKIKNISVYGQESNPTTWRLAAMNMAIRGIDFDFGKKPGDTFTKDQHPDLRADFVLANPPFNQDEWWDGSLEGDARWKYGTPPESNGNFAWIQHMLHHCSPNGKVGLVLANMSLSSNDKNEANIRKNIVNEDLVECIISLPDKLFTSTPIEASIWILNKDKKHKRETLFMDASNLGMKVTRTLNAISEDVSKKISTLYHDWLREFDSVDTIGLCKSINIDTIREKSYNLFPANYTDKSKKNNESVIDEIEVQIEKINKNYEYLKDINTELNPKLHELVKSLQAAGDAALEAFKLSDFLVESTETLGEDEEPEILTLTENAGFVYQRERFSKRIATDNTVKYKIVKKTDIAYNQYLLWAGAIDQCWIVDVGITSPAYKVFRIKDNFDSSLIGRVLKSDYMLQQYEGISFGTVKRRKRAPVELFLNLEIMLPPLHIQQSIKETIDLIQAEIFEYKSVTRKLNDLLDNIYREIT